MEYIKFKLLELKNNFQAPCDIFIKLRGKGFEKIIEDNDFYDEDLLKTYYKQGINDIYIREEDLERFQNHFDQKLQKEVKQKSYVEGSTSSTLQNAYKKVRSFAKKVEISEETVELIEGIQVQAIQLIKKGNKDIFDLLMNSIKKENYLNDHSMQVSLVCCAVAMKINWSTKTNLNKFILASLFHDLSLEDDSLAKINYISEAYEQNLSDREIRDIISHPIQSCDLFIKTDMNLSDVEKIILYHHELPDQSGFPGKYDAYSLPPNICLFILAQEFVNTIVYNDFTDSAWDELNHKFSDFYNKGNFQKPLQGFVKVFKKIKLK